MATKQRDRRFPVLVALMLSMALMAMDTTIVATAIPQVVGDLGGFNLIGWVFSVYLLANTVTIPVYGKLADLYGRKPVLVFGIVLFLIGSALSAASWNMLSLIIFRAVQGLGAGSIAATVNTVAADLYRVEERGKIQGWLSSVWGISAIAAPAAGGIFAEYASWRWIFLVNLPLGAIALAMLMRYLKENVVRERHRIDYAGAGLILVASGLLVFGLLQGGTSWAWLSVPSFVVFGGAVLAFVMVTVVERRAAEPVVPPWLWTRRLTAGSYVATLIAGLMMIGLSTSLPTWAQSVLGLSPIAAGFVLAVMTVTWPLASSQAHRLYLRIGFRDTALIGCGLTLVAEVIFVTLDADAAPWQPTVASAVMGAGMGLLSMPMLIGLQSTVGWSERGVITSGSMFSRTLGQSLGAAIFGAITNFVLLSRLDSAPADVRGGLPSSVSDISRLLADGHEDEGVAAYLRDSLHLSMHTVFVGLLIAGVLTFLVLVFVVPRQFPVYEETAELQLADEGASALVVDAAGGKGFADGIGGAKRSDDGGRGQRDDGPT
ncbi:EmrB/QacA subfamily drug resistance transporter [Antricoccus suffuscus]|uniref:EmrB/QacA subfamily drug resistance transporter n=1 Tax=Antricoccus suffuscus TaxID=1629062 RepID=A0A2T1A5S0_9ACTN|nr:MFS transporter [Antricoccus suffuscus]PRZ43688.1 EmrB/QacA subfamily drug resistance transporter [Antricoccus suffuscus]